MRARCWHTSSPLERSHGHLFSNLCRSGISTVRDVPFNWQISSESARWGGRGRHQHPGPPMIAGNASFFSFRETSQGSPPASVCRVLVLCIELQLRLAIADQTASVYRCTVRAGAFEEGILHRARKSCCQGRGWRFRGFEDNF